MSIISIEFSNNKNLKLLFSNDLELTFKLNDEWIEPPNISVMKDGNFLHGCRLLNDGTIENQKTCLTSYHTELNITNVYGRTINTAWFSGVKTLLSEWTIFSILYLCPTKSV